LLKKSATINPKSESARAGLYVLKGGDLAQEISDDGTSKANKYSNNFKEDGFNEKYLLYRVMNR